MTKPKEFWVSRHPHSRGFFEAYARQDDDMIHVIGYSAYEDLQVRLAIAVKLLKEGKAKFAPNTTNSFVDEFIKDHEAKQAAKIEEVKE